MAVPANRRVGGRELWDRADAPSVAVVVGASGGLGAAFLRTLADQGRYDHIVGIARRRPEDWPVDWPEDRAWTFIEADVVHENQIADAARHVARLGRVDRIVVATGLLHSDRVSPEKTMRSLDAGSLIELFTVNAVGPALVAKHFLPLTPRDSPSLFAVLSARVGSITDNRLGGWHAYRASKAALNMLLATLAIEHRRTRPLGVCVALHPGTVETNLSAPFQHGGAAGPKRMTPAASAQALVGLMDRFRPLDSGGFFAWDGTEIPW